MNNQETNALSAQLARIERNTLLGAKKVLTVEDFALLAGVSKRTVYRLTGDHKIPYYKPNGKDIYFDRAEVESWLLKNRIASNEELQQRAVNDVVLGKGHKGAKGGKV